MWLSNNKKYATDGFWKSVHEVGSCTKWWGTVVRADVLWIPETPKPPSKLWPADP
jgi:hypothetical protein